jgi:hypothetical protein
MRIDSIRGVTEMWNNRNKAFVRSTRATFVTNLKAEASWLSSRHIEVSFNNDKIHISAPQGQPWSGGGSQQHAKISRLQDNSAKTLHILPVKRARTHRNPSA